MADTYVPEIEEGLKKVIEFPAIRGRAASKPELKKMHAKSSPTCRIFPPR
jgi:hypothetical protein